MKKILLLFFAASFLGQTISAQEVPLLRIRANGATITATDSGPDWEGGVAGGSTSGTVNGIAYTVNEGNLYNPNAANRITAKHSSVPAYVPLNIFFNERWDPPGGSEMEWTFTLPNDDYIIRLYMGSSFNGADAVGDRVFDIEVEGVVPTVLDGIDLVDQFGHHFGGMIEHSLTLADGVLNIIFIHDVENPLINAIEILEPDVAAPITLADFTAKPHTEKSVMLDWSTSSEENNEYFSIEHSTDGRNFTSIDKVEGALNSTVMQYYSYEHKDANKGNNYYRLRQVDTDGTFSFSPIEVVKLAGDLEIKVLPTLADNFVTIGVDEAFDNDVDVEIYDVLGRLVFAQTLGRGDLQVEIPVSDFQKGHYFVRIKNNAKSRVARFIKR